MIPAPADLSLWGALVAGAAAATAAVIGRYRDLPPFLAGGASCGAQTCQTLFRTPRAALLGVPNAALGLLLYAALAVGIARGWPPLLLWLGACPALAMSLFLGAGLLRRKIPCRICWLGHAANGWLWVMLGWRAFGTGVTS